MAARTINDWLTEYGASHKNATNKKLHFVCVPLIFFSVVGLLWSIPMPEAVADIPFANLATLSLLFIIGYYARLSRNIMLGMVAFSAFCLAVLYALDGAGVNILYTSIAIFVLAWIGQFIGHEIEGKKPSFFKDLQFLMIGPAWIMGYLYRRLGIGYEPAR